VKLYHGTNGKWIDSILRNGLEPRGNRTARNNWKSVPHQSNRHCVYLTDSYAPYFAFNAARGKDAMCAVVEIDTDLLNKSSLIYDEDCWEQLGRGRDHVPGNMSERTLFYRNKQGDPAMHQLYINKQKQTNWELSLMALGTCCHWGKIDPSAITRAIVWPHAPNVQLCFVWDPTITLINQQICGDRYRALTARLFGDPVPVTCEFDRFQINFALSGATHIRRGEGQFFRHPYSIAIDPALEEEKQRFFTAKETVA
jgi:hypothetical protein